MHILRDRWRKCLADVKSVHRKYIDKDNRGLRELDPGYCETGIVRLKVAPKFGALVHSAVGRL
jgi:hypothetical protein